MGRITWTPGTHGGQTGHILGEAKGHKAKIEVFRIGFDSRGDASNPWTLAHRLPFRGIERKFGSVAEAQKSAERYLLWAMELMGFKPTLPADEDRLARLVNEYTASMPKDDVHLWAEEIVKELRK